MAAATRGPLHQLLPIITHTLPPPSRQTSLQLWSIPHPLVLQVAKPQAVMNILKQAYGDNKAAVNDELVQMVLEPGLQVHPPVWSRFRICLV